MNHYQFAGLDLFRHNQFSAKTLPNTGESIPFYGLRYHQGAKHEGAWGLMSFILKLQSTGLRLDGINSRPVPRIKRRDLGKDGIP